MATTVTDSGATLLIAGDSEDAVRLEVATRQRDGCRLVGAPARVGSRWFATITKQADVSFSRTPDGRAERIECSIERLGLQVVVRGPTEEAVRDAIDNLALGGARLIAAPECLRGEWTAVLDAPR
jgi:hypothetical protein